MVFKTRKGMEIDPLNPQPEVIDIEDIAVGLTNMPRSAGQSKVSVAQHCLKLVSLVRIDFPEDYELQLACLLHDASEAYMADVPKPWKQLCPEYRRLEKMLLKAIFTRFGVDLSYLTSDLVKVYDEVAYKEEGSILPLGKVDVKKLYMSTFKEIYDKTKAK